MPTNFLQRWVIFFYVCLQHKKKKKNKKNLKKKIEQKMKGVLDFYTQGLGCEKNTASAIQLPPH